MNTIFSKPSRRWGVSLSILGLVLALTAGAASAQDRTPAQRQALADLAYVLGQSHALRQLCAGQGDQFWRARMQRMIDTEAPDPDFDRQLKQAFNTGYAATETRFTDCDADSRREEARVAARGRALAGEVAQ